MRGENRQRVLGIGRPERLEAALFKDVHHVLPDQDLVLDNQDDRDFVRLIGAHGPETTGYACGSRGV